MELTSNLSPTLNLLSDILDQFLEAGFNVTEYTGGLEIIEAQLNERILCYMEAIEIISNLLEQKKLQNNREIDNKLISIARVPLQYYLYLLRVKDIKTAISEVKDMSSDHDEMFIKRLSSQSIVTKLEQSNSMLQLDMNNFQDTLPQWIKKYGDLISRLFAQTELRKMSTCLSICQ